MASHPGPRGPGAQQRVPPSPDEEIPSTAGGVSMRGAPVGSNVRGTLGNVGAVESAGTRTAGAVRRLLTPGAGAFREESFLGGKDKDIERTRIVLSPAETARQQSVRSLRAGGPRGRGLGDPTTNVRTGLTEAVGGTPTSGRTRGAVPSGGTAGGGVGVGVPTFAAAGNFRSGVLGKGLFLDTTGLSAIDKLNPRG